MAILAKTKDVALWAASFICTLAYDVAFHLYKGLDYGDDLFFHIALSCIQLSANEVQQHDLRTRPEKDGRYFYIESQPSMEKLTDSEKVVMKVTGQFENDSKDSREKRLFK